MVGGGLSEIAPESEFAFLEDSVLYCPIAFFVDLVLVTFLSAKYPHIFFGKGNWSLWPDYCALVMFRADSFESPYKYQY